MIWTFLKIITFLLLFCFTLSHLFFDLRFLTVEDGFIENTGAALWLIGIIFAVLIILKNQYEKKTVAFLLLLVCFVALGEEISWGQRIFDLETPSFIAAANRQSELNFHNLYIFSGGSTWREFFKTGSFNYQQIIDAQNLFRIWFIVFFFLFPFLYNTKHGANLLLRVGYYKPNFLFTLIIWLYLVFSFLITIGQTASYIHSIQEIREMAFALFVGMYLCKFYFYTKKAPILKQMPLLLTDERCLLNGKSWGKLTPQIGENELV